MLNRLMPLIAVAMFIVLATSVHADEIVTVPDSNVTSDFNPAPPGGMVIKYTNATLENDYAKLVAYQNASYTFESKLDGSHFYSDNYYIAKNDTNLTEVDAYITDCLILNVSSDEECIRFDKFYDDYTNLTVEQMFNEHGNMKSLIYIIAGDTADYDIRFSGDSDNDSFSSGSYIRIGSIVYDFSDITALYNTEFENESGETYQNIELGAMTLGQEITIDPLITTTTTNNLAHTTLLRDVNTSTMYFLTNNATYRQLYKSIDNGTTWNILSTSNTLFISGRRSAVLQGSGNTAVIHFAEIGCRYGNFSVNTSAWVVTNNSVHCWNELNTGVADDAMLSMEIDNSNNLFVIGTYNFTATANPYLWWRNSTGWFSSVIGVGTRLTNDVADLSTSNDYVLMLFQDSSGGGTPSQRYRLQVFNKTSWSLVAGSYQDRSTIANVLEQGGTFTADYDNNILLGGAQNTANPNSWIYVESYNGTSYSTRYSVNLNGYTASNLFGYYISKTIDGKYYYVSDDPSAGGSALLLNFNATGWSSGNISLDIEQPINLTATQINQGQIVSGSTTSMQFANGFDNYFYYAYQLSSTGFWYVDKYQKGVFLQAFDELNNTRLSNWSVTISNNTYSQTYPTLTSNYILLEGWSGNVTLKFSKAGYYDRFYVLYIDNSIKSFNGYLLETTKGQLVTFIVLDYNTNNPLQNSLINITKLIGGSYQLIESRYTDASGTSSFFLDPEQQYRISVYKSGYSTYSNYITPTLTTYTIYMSQNISFVSNNSLTGISVFQILPLNNIFSKNTIVNNSFRLNDTLNITTLFGMSIVLGNGTVLNTQTSTNSSGGYFNYSHNYTDIGNYTEIVFFDRFGYPRYYSNQTYYIVNNTAGNWTLGNFLLNTKNQSTGSEITLYLLTLIICAFIIVFVSQVNSNIAPFVGLGWLCLATLVGWFNPILTLLCGILIFVASYIMSNLSSVS